MHHDQVEKTSLSESLGYNNLVSKLEDPFKDIEYGQFLNEQWYMQVKPYLKLNAAQHKKPKPEPDNMIVQ